MFPLKPAAGCMQGDTRHTIVCDGVDSIDLTTGPGDDEVTLSNVNGSRASRRRERHGALRFWRRRDRRWQRRQHNHVQPCRRRRGQRVARRRRERRSSQVKARTSRVSSASSVVPRTTRSRARLRARRSTAAAVPTSSRTSITRRAQARERDAARRRTRTTNAATASGGERATASPTSTPCTAARARTPQGKPGRRRVARQRRQRHPRRQGRHQHRRLRRQGTSVSRSSLTLPGRAARRDATTIGEPAPDVDVRERSTGRGRRSVHRNSQANTCTAATATTRSGDAGRQRRSTAMAGYDILDGQVRRRLHGRRHWTATRSTYSCRTVPRSCHVNGDVRRRFDGRR